MRLRNRRSRAPPGPERGIFASGSSGVRRVVFELVRFERMARRCDFSRALETSESSALGGLARLRSRRDLALFLSVPVPRGASRSGRIERFPGCILALLFCRFRRTARDLGWSALFRGGGSVRLRRLPCHYFHLASSRDEFAARRLRAVVCTRGVLDSHGSHDFYWPGRSRRRASSSRAVRHAIDAILGRSRVARRSRFRVVGYRALLACGHFGVFWCRSDPFRVCVRLGFRSYGGTLCGAPRGLCYRAALPNGDRR